MGGPVAASLFAGDPRDAPAPVAPTPVAPASLEGGEIPGVCEASAIVHWEGGFLLGDNETEDRLPVYSTTFGPRAAVMLSTPIEDIEAVAVTSGGQLLVVGSQGANKNGKPRPAREWILQNGSPPVRPDLTACAACIEARSLPPKEGGLSVEGAAWWQGAWWLGVRSPTPGGATLLLPMEGDPTTGLRAGPPVALDLGGLGVRDLLVHDGALLVLAGPVDGRATPHLVYRLTSPTAAPERLPIELPPGSEGMVVDGGSLVVVIDGDGEPGRPCKVPARWVRVPMP